MENKRGRRNKNEDRGKDIESMNVVAKEKMEKGRLKWKEE